MALKNLWGLIFHNSDILLMKQQSHAVINANYRPDTQGTEL